jgi:hypothetical protein
VEFRSLLLGSGDIGLKTFQETTEFHWLYIYRLCTTENYSGFQRCSPAPPG